MSRLIVILGDQLSTQINALKYYRSDKDSLFMCEVNELVDNVKHHKKKLAFVFSAMRHYAKELKAKGYNLDYVAYDDHQNTHTLYSEVKRSLDNGHFDKVIITSPNDYYLLQSVKSWQQHSSVVIDIIEDERFYCTISDFKRWAKSKKNLRMEFFYREMRKKHNILMTSEGKPEGGAWNYDAQNRKRLPHSNHPPTPFQVTPDQITLDAISMVAKHFDKNFGELRDFHYAVTREQALAALKYFIDHQLNLFGDFQDAMRANDPFLYHSNLSLYINCGLISPKECIDSAIDAYRHGSVALNSVEGFVRQIIGWREFIRNIYWLYMPEYERLNFFEANKSLPHFYWDTQTKMNCLHHCIKDTQQHAYAHHIQRLMVLGNFATLTGLSPSEVNEWFLIVYADAYSWVELPNVSGMALFADGGKFASKPYIASGKYIHKMSDYCQSCQYNVNQRDEDNACPFNFLYWHFLIKHRKKLESNARMRLVYTQLDKFSESTQASITAKAQSFIGKLESVRTTANKNA